MTIRNTNSRFSFESAENNSDNSDICILVLYAPGIEKARYRYSSKIIAPKGVMFPQNKGNENSGDISISKTKGGSSQDGVSFYTLKKEELPMNVKIPYQNLKAKQKKSIIVANQKKKADRKGKNNIEGENIGLLPRAYIHKYNSNLVASHFATKTFLIFLLHLCFASKKYIPLSISDNCT